MLCKYYILILFSSLITGGVLCMCKYNVNKNTGKFETDEQHYYYLYGYCMLPFGAKRTARAVRNEIINNKKELEASGLEFPFKRIVSVRTINKWINLFNWEANRLNMYYEQAVGISDYINEFNLLQVERKAKRIDLLNDCLDALESVLISVTTNLESWNNKEAIYVLTQLGYIYKALESLHDSQTVAVNTIQEFIKDWIDIKDRLQPHHNNNVTSEANLSVNIDTIDYFFDTYCNI